MEVKFSGHTHEKRKSEKKKRKKKINEKRKVKNEQGYM